MIQQMLAMWSLFPLPFLKPAWTSGSSWYMNCWCQAWRLTVPKTTKMMLVRPLMTNLKTTVRADGAALHVSPQPPALSMEALTPAVSVSGTWPLNRCHHLSPPSCRHLKESKLSFPPTWPVYWLWSGKQPEPQPLLVTWLQILHSFWLMAMPIL